MLDSILNEINKKNIQFLCVPPKSGSSNGSFTFTSWKCNELMSLCRLQRWVVSYVCDIVPSGNKRKSEKLIEIDPTNLESITEKTMKTWCEQRNINTSKMPTGNTRTKKMLRFVWFKQLMENPEDLFADFGTDEIIEYVSSEHTNFNESLMNCDDDVQQRHFVENFVKEEGILPPPINYFGTQPDHKLTYEPLTEVVSLFHCLVCRIMSKNSTNMTFEIKRFIHLFLTKFHQLDVLITPEDTVINVVDKNGKSVKKSTFPKFTPCQIYYRCSTYQMILTDLVTLDSHGIWTERQRHSFPS